MADIILFRPKVFSGEVQAIRPRPPLGLLFVAAPLVQNNYTVRIIDQEVDLNWLEILDRELDGSTICVGVSSMTGIQILNGLEFSKAVKKKRDVPIIWGGLHPSILPDQTIENPYIDIVVRGEGEEVFLKVANALRNGGSLDGMPSVWWKKGREIYSNPIDKFIDLSKIPSLPYHLINCEKYMTIKRSSHPGCKRIFDIQTDRGCPYRCAFCYNINVNHRKWRPFSAQRLLDEIKYLVSKFSLDGVNFLGDNFFVDKERVVEICNGIIGKGIKIGWHADCRVDYFSKCDDSFIELIKRSGCKLLTFGVESGSEKILSLINKDISLNQVYEVNRKLKRHELEVNYHFMAGFLQETREDVLETYGVMLKLCEAYHRADFLGPSVYTPYPGTPLFDSSVAMGFIPPKNLEEWARFGWDENTCMPFIDCEHSKWLINGINVIKGASTFKRVFGLRCMGRWFEWRAKLIIKFNIIGPAIEQKIIRLVNIIAATFK